MTPAEHYRETERLLNLAAMLDERGQVGDFAYYHSAAQVHATLAAAPAEHGPAGDYRQGDAVTVVISGVRVDGIGDWDLHLDVPGLDDVLSLRVVDDEGRELPQVRVYRAKGGA